MLARSWFLNFFLSLAVWEWYMLQRAIKINRIERNASVFRLFYAPLVSVFLWPCRCLSFSVPSENSLWRVVCLALEVNAISINTFAVSAWGLYFSQTSDGGFMFSVSLLVIFSVIWFVLSAVLHLTWFIIHPPPHTHTHVLELSLW